MSFLRADGKPFVTDRRGAVPQVVIEDGEDGEAVVVHQFTLDKVRIGPRPYDHGDARRACMELIQKARKTARTLAEPGNNGCFGSSRNRANGSTGSTG